MEKIDKDWIAAEKITAMLQKALSSNTTVEHNKFLPVIGRPDREPRQCDVVLTLNNITTIIEVQDRKEKPDITTFHGWTVKRDEVGAKHLICVTAAGYPESIINEVKYKYKSSVTLMTLDEFHYLTNPQKINLIPTKIDRHPNITFLEIGTMMLGSLPEGEFPTLKQDEKCFSFGTEGKKIDVRDLTTHFYNKLSPAMTLVEVNMNKLFQPDSGMPTEEEMKVEISADDNIYLHFKEKVHKIKKWSFTIKINYTETLYQSEVKQYKYRIELIDETIAWIASTVVLLDGKLKTVNLVFKNINGYLFVTEHYIADDNNAC